MTHISHTPLVPYNQEDFEAVHNFLARAEVNADETAVTIICPAVIAADIIPPRCRKPRPAAFLTTLTVDIPIVANPLSPVLDFRENERCPMERYAKDATGTLYLKHEATVGDLTVGGYTPRENWPRESYFTDRDGSVLYSNVKVYLAPTLENGAVNPLRLLESAMRNLADPQRNLGRWRDELRFEAIGPEQGSYHQPGSYRETHYTSNLDAAVAYLGNLLGAAAAASAYFDGFLHTLTSEPTFTFGIHGLHRTGEQHRGEAASLPISPADPPLANHFTSRSGHVEVHDHAYPFQGATVDQATERLREEMYAHINAISPLLINPQGSTRSDHEDLHFDSDEEAVASYNWANNIEKQVEKASAVADVLCRLEELAS